MVRKIAMSTVRGISVRESIDMAVNSGCEGIDIKVDYLPEEEEKKKEILDYAKEKGLELSLHAPCSDINIAARNQGIRKESINQVKKIIDMAQKYGARVVTFHPGRLTSIRENSEEKWKILLDSVAEIAAYAAEKRVHAALENMECRKKELVRTVSDLNRFAVLAAENPYFGAALEISHFAANRIFLPELDELKLPIKNVYISQYMDGRPHFSLTEANGEIQLDKVQRLLDSVGYDSYMILGLKSIQGCKVFEESRKILEDSFR